MAAYFLQCFAMQMYNPFHFQGHPFFVANFLAEIRNLSHCGWAYVTDVELPFHMVGSTREIQASPHNPFFRPTPAHLYARQNILYYCNRRKQTIFNHKHYLEKQPNWQWHFTSLACIQKRSWYRCVATGLQWVKRLR